MGIKYLNYDDRKKLESLYLENQKISDIAEKLSVSYSTVYRELERGTTGILDKNGRIGYSAEQGQITLHSRLKHRKLKLEAKEAEK